MTKAHAVDTTWWLALALAGCVAERAPSSPSSPPEGTYQDEPEVQSVPQALGGWATRYTAQANEVPIHLGAQYAVFKRTVSSCDSPVVVRIDGTVLPTSGFPSCVLITSAGSSDTLFHVLVAATDASGHRLYELGSPIPPPPMGGAGGAPGTAGSGAPPPPDNPWHVAALTGPNVTKIVVSPTYVYWEDAYAIRRWKFGDANSFNLVTGHKLLAIEVPADATQTVLYAQSGSGSSFSLVRIHGGNGSVTPLFTAHTKPFKEGFSFDATHFYWVENAASGQTSRLKQLTKSGSSLTNFRSSTDVTYHEPDSISSALYWRETIHATGSSNIRRRSHANGNVVTEPFPMTTVTEMRVLSGSGVYAAGLVGSGHQLQRGAL